LSVIKYPVNSLLIFTIIDYNNRENTGEDMKYKQIIILLLALIALMGAPSASARPSYLESFNQHYDTGGTKLDSCSTCHSGEARNLYGKAYAENGKSFTAIENLDSDKDEITNLAEINALTFPGDPNDHPQNTTEAIPETTINGNETSVNATPEQPATEAPGNTANEQTTTEVPASNATQAQPTSETPGNTSEEQKSPGFEALFAVVGILAVVCLKRKDIWK
jgi:hypothetical protein